MLDRKGRCGWGEAGHTALASIPNSLGILSSPAFIFGYIEAWRAEGQGRGGGVRVGGSKAQSCVGMGGKGVGGGRGLSFFYLSPVRNKPYACGRNNNNGNNDDNVLFCVLFLQLRTGTRSPLQSKEPKHS